PPPEQPRLRPRPRRRHHPPRRRRLRALRSSPPCRRPLPRRAAPDRPRRPDARRPRHRRTAPAHRPSPPLGRTRRLRPARGRARAPACRRGLRRRSMSTEPERVEVSLSQGLEIVWKDGHRSRYAIAALPAASRLRAAKPVGHYALHFEFSDGHTTGIYTWEYLRSLCPCPDCL